MKDTGPLTRKRMETADEEFLAATVVHNIIAYSRGLVGYQTPNLDRIANEGVAFTDYYALT